jgi:Fe2+ or Zn2+ uptake regulation protein
MPSKTPVTACTETISRRGLRLTQQRRQVFDVLMARQDHPTAIQVFLRVKERMPSISLATVYNCLETLTACGLVKHVNLDRAPSRYCANLEEHGHFFCDSCGAVIDVPLSRSRNERWTLPRGAVVTGCETSLRGDCPECARKKRKTKS